MKSKAQEYFEAFNKPQPERITFKVNVGEKGGSAIIASVTAARPKPACSLGSCVITTEEALALRDWLTDTFDTPDQINYSTTSMCFEGMYDTTPAPHGYDWVKDIKPGFVGKTRSGELLTYTGRHGDFFVWETPEYEYDLNFYSITSMYADKMHNLDIVGPWERV